MASLSRARVTKSLCRPQCYTHNNLGWKIHVVDAGAHSRRDSKNLSAGAAGLQGLGHALGLGAVLTVAVHYLMSAR